MCLQYVSSSTGHIQFSLKARKVIQNFQLESSKCSKNLNVNECGRFLPVEKDYRGHGERAVSETVGAVEGETWLDREEAMRKKA